MKFSELLDKSPQLASCVVAISTELAKEDANTVTLEMAPQADEWRRLCFVDYKLRDIEHEMAVASTDVYWPYNRVVTRFRVVVRQDAIVKGPMSEILAFCESASNGTLGDAWPLLWQSPALS